MKNIPIKKITSLAQKFNLAVVILFGSQTHGRVHGESDIDIAFYAFHKVGEETLYEELVHIIGRADIDLVNLATTHNHVLRFEVFHRGTLLYESEKGLKSKMEWESYVDHVDFQGYYSLRSELLDRKLAEMVA